jgi:DNA-binding transcriptional ArsR family regulator
MNGEPGPRELLALLAEPDRLRALAAVALGAGTLTEVAERAGLEPKAAARALSRLVAGGLLDGEPGGGYRVRAEAIQAAARPPETVVSGGTGLEAPLPLVDPAAGGDGPGGGPPEPPAGSPEAAVLRRFVHRGRLLSVPAARGKRLIVMNYLAGLFEPGRRYPEGEVNELLGRYHPDYALLRRYLVDDGFLDRADEPAPSGSRLVKLYWRTGGTVDLAAPTSS